MITPVYTGQNQQQAIPVPRPTLYQYIDGEEGPWSMIPYAYLWPKPPPPLYSRVVPPTYRAGGPATPMKLQMGWKNEDGVFILAGASSSTAFLPPRVQTTDLWAANQMYPL